MPTPANLFALILFGTIGLAAFLYAKKVAALKPAVIGVALMFYPWLFDRTWLLYAIGSALCLALYFFRD